jgi:DNA-binding IclR family transcriptional regulator
MVRQEVPVAQNATLTDALLHATLLGMATIGSLERGLKILDLLIEVESDPVRREKGLSIQLVATELELHKSTASRLMQTLVNGGYAVPSRPSGRGFRLGPAVQTHSPVGAAQRRLGELGRPVLTRLVEATGECAHSAVSAGSAALVIDDVETVRPLRVVAGKGRRVPLHCTSAGKCLLAFGLAPVPVELAARTARTITNPQMLKLHLTDIVEQGYAVDDEENDLGVRCISAPVFDGVGGEPVGCIGIDGPTVRMTPEILGDLAAQVVEAAHELTAKLGELRALESAAG